MKLVSQWPCRSAEDGRREMCVNGEEGGCVCVCVVEGKVVRNDARTRYITHHFKCLDVISLLHADFRNAMLSKPHPPNMTCYHFVPCPSALTSLRAWTMASVEGFPQCCLPCGRTCGCSTCLLLRVLSMPERVVMATPGYISCGCRSPAS